MGFVIAGCFTWIAWVLSNNHELSIHPTFWASDGQWKSPRWFAPSSTTIFRYIHNLVGATAIAGLWIAGIGWWRWHRAPDPRDTHVWMIRFGLMSAAAATAAQIVVGLLFLFAMDEAVRAQLMGFKTIMGGFWTVTLIPAIAAPTLLAYAALHPERFGWFVLSLLAAVVVLAAMLLGREQVRLTSLAQPAAGAFVLTQWTIYAQPTSLVIFLVLLVAGLGIVGLMMWWITSGRRTDHDPAAIASSPPGDSDSPTP